MSTRLYHEQAELAVLGAIVVRNAAFDEIADVLEADHFGRQHHGDVFAAMQALHMAGKAIDPITLSAQLTKAGKLEDVGQVFLYGLGNGVPASTNIGHYARIVRDKAMLRRLRDRARQIVAEAEAGDLESAELLEQAEQGIFAIGAQAVTSEWLSGAELARELYPLIERLNQRGQALSGVPTGFVDLDQMTRGFQKSDLILLGARPSQGKTAFGISAALHAARTVNVGVFSVEMSKEGIGIREVIHEADVDGWRLLSGRASDVELRRVGEGLARLGELNIFLNESAYLSPLHVRSHLRRLRSRAGALGLVVIDYLQLLAPLPDDRRENKTNQVAGISRALKLLAREFGVPFLVLSQLHRVPENRRPTMADLRDSGALEQDADVVLLLHRPEVYEPRPENAGLAELIIGKHRNGPTGIVELTWRGEPMRFENRAAS